MGSLQFQEEQHTNWRNERNVIKNKVYFISKTGWCRQIITYSTKVEQNQQPVLAKSRIIIWNDSCIYAMSFIFCNGIFCNGIHLDYIFLLPYLK